jgi:hypothetical protein
MNDSFGRLADDEECYEEYPQENADYQENDPEYEQNDPGYEENEQAQQELVIDTGQQEYQADEQEEQDYNEEASPPGYVNLWFRFML